MLERISEQNARKDMKSRDGHVTYHTTQLPLKQCRHSTLKHQRKISMVEKAGSKQVS